MNWFLTFLGIKLFEIVTTWLTMKSRRKNIQAHMDLLKLKPSSRKLSRSTGLSIRYKLAKAMTPMVSVPGFGDLLYLGIMLGRFSNRKAITRAYEKATLKIDEENLSDALQKAGNSNLALYKKAKREAGFLSVAGHSEIARQALITLDNLLIDASLAGIDLRSEQSIQIAVFDTAELVSSLVKEEQTGVHSNIDIYLNVVDSIKKDLAGKKSVFMELNEPQKKANGS